MALVVRSLQAIARLPNRPTRLLASHMHTCRRGDQARRTRTWCHCCARFCIRKGQEVSSQHWRGTLGPAGHKITCHPNCAHAAEQMRWWHEQSESLKHFTLSFLLWPLQRCLTALA